jgi:hypothetical protein
MNLRWDSTKSPHLEVRIEPLEVRRFHPGEFDVTENWEDVPFGKSSVIGAGARPKRGFLQPVVHETLDDAPSRVRQCPRDRILALKGRVAALRRPRYVRRQPFVCLESEEPHTRAHPCGDAPNLRTHALPNPPSSGIGTVAGCSTMSALLRGPFHASRGRGACQNRPGRIG